MRQTMARPGWARPKNAPRTDLVHWWRPDGHMACDHDRDICYIGPKQDDPALGELCPACTAIVVAAANVLGVNPFAPTVGSEGLGGATRPAESAQANTRGRPMNTTREQDVLRDMPSACNVRDKWSPVSLNVA